MSPKACEACGADCLKSKGKYQEFCPQCYQSKANRIERHVEQCEEETCEVCHSKLVEMRVFVRELYLQVLLERELRTQKLTLGDFK